MIFFFNKDGYINYFGRGNEKIMRRTVLFLVISLVFFVLAAGCNAPAPVPVTPEPTSLPLPTATTPANAAIFPFSGDWVLTSMANQGGTNPVTTSGITLSLSPNGQISGFDGCNNYNAQFTLTGTTSAYGTGIAIGSLGVTNVSCSGVVAQQENAYIGVLQHISAFAGDNTHLTLTDNSQDTLVYMRPWVVTTPPTVGFNIAPY